MSRTCRILAVAAVLTGVSSAETPESLKDLVGQINQLADQGNFDDAEGLAMKVVNRAFSELGPEHVDTGGALDLLGSLYAKQMKFVEAEPLLRRSLAIIQKCEPDSAAEGHILRDLGDVCCGLKKYDEAETLLARSLILSNEKFGPVSPQFMLTMKSLGALYKSQHEYRLAEECLRKVLDTSEKQDPAGVMTAGILKELANVYFEQEKFAEAEPLYRRELAIVERSLGPVHPEIADALNNVGIVCAKLGKNQEAESLVKRALAIFENSLGPNHETTERVRRNLQTFRQDQSKAIAE